MIASMMSELELEGSTSEGESHDLMPKANAEDRFLPEQAPNVAYGIVHGLRIARTIGKKDSVWLQAEDLVRRCGRWHHGHAPAAMHKIAEDVGLDTEIVGHNMCSPRFGSG